jgi:hypothetical protein
MCRFSCYLLLESSVQCQHRSSSGVRSEQTPQETSWPGRRRPHIPTIRCQVNHLAPRVRRKKDHALKVQILFHTGYLIRDISWYASSCRNVGRGWGIALRQSSGARFTRDIPIERRCTVHPVGLTTSRPASRSGSLQSKRGLERANLVRQEVPASCISTLAGFVFRNLSC